MIKVESRRNAGHAGPGAKAARSRRLRASASVQTLILALGVTAAGLIALTVTAEAQQYWDGAGTTGNGAIDGGSGTWNATNTNWTGPAGGINSAYNSGEPTIFGRANGLQSTVGGIVSVDNSGGQIVLSQAVNFTATSDQTIFTISDGGLQINGSGTTFNVADVSLSAGNDATIASNLTGAAGDNLIKTNNGTLTLSGANTYAGDTTVNGGTLIISGSVTSALIDVNNDASVVVGGGSLQDDADVDLSATANLTLSGDEVIGRLTGTMGTTVDLGANRLIVAGNGETAIFAGQISGSGGITKSGSDELSLTGNNSYTGDTVINGGVLRADGDDNGNNAIGSTTDMDGNIIDSAVVINGGELNITDSERIGSLSGLTTGLLSVNTDSLLTINQTVDGLYAGKLRAFGNIDKIGDGTLTLAGANDQLDTTFRLREGGLRLEDDIALGDSNANQNTIADAGTTIDYGNGVTIDENIVINSGGSGSTVSFNQTGGSAEQSGDISGDGALAKTGNGRLILSGNNSYGGSTTITAGTLEVRGNDALNDDGLTTIRGTGTLQVAENEAIGSLNNDGVAEGAIVIDSGQTLFVNQNSLRTFGGSISGAGRFQKQNGGTLILTGDTTLGGGVVITDGALSIGNGGSGGTLDADVTNNSELIFNHDSAVVYDGDVSGTGVLTTRGPGQLTLNGTISNAGGIDLNAGSNVVIGGNVDLADQAVQLQANDVSATLVNNGTIRSRDAVAVEVRGSNSSLNLTNNGTIDSIEGDYAVVLGGNSSLTNTGRIDGAFSGAVLLKDGAGTINVNLEAGSTVDGSIRSQDGGTRNVTIAGTLTGGYFGSAGADTVTLSTTGAFGTFAGGALDGGGGTDVLGLTGATAGEVDMTRVRNFEQGVKSGTGTFALVGAPAPGSFLQGWSFNAGTVVIGANDQLGGINPGGADASLFFNGGTLALAAGSETTSDRNVGLGVAGTLESRTGASLTISGVISGNGTLTKTGDGALTLSGANTYNGATRLEAGTLVLSGSSALGSDAAGTSAAGGTAIDFAANATNNDSLQLDGGVTLVQQGILPGDSARQGGVVTGDGTAVLTKTGDGTLVLGGSNGAGQQFSGRVEINGGTLSIGDPVPSGDPQDVFGDTVTNSTIVNVNAGGTLGGSGTIAGSVFVKGGQTNPGASPGTLNIAGDLTYDANSTATFELNQPGTVGGANDLIRVGGSLALGGTLELITTSGGPVGSGFYRLYEYDTNNAGGVLSGSFATVTPDTGSIVYNINTTNPGQINLAVTNGEQLMQFWDGNDQSGNGIVDGGDGIWNLGSTNWTGSPGEPGEPSQAEINGPWFGGVAVFFDAAGVGGNVTVQGPQNVQGLSFSNGPYTLAGDGIVLTGNTISGANQNISTVFVEFGVTGTVASQISGSTGSIVLSKDGAGALVLSGANSYGGGTLLNQGAIVANNSAAFGTGAVSAAGATVIGYGDGVSIANQVAVTGAVTFDQSGGTATQAGAVSGTGSITKTGAGRLDFTQLAGTLSGVTNAGGTLNAVNTGSVTSAGVALTSGGSATNFQNNGTISGSLASSTGSTFTLGNAGTLNLVPGSVSNLAGNDTINNSGILNTLGNTQLAGLERFNNSGTINMSNGVTGDVLTIGGDFAASGNSRLIVDIDLGRGDASTVDKLVVTGNGSGSSTTIQLNNLSGDNLSLITNPIVIADFQGTNSSQGPRAEGLPRGLIAYFVSQDAAGDWVLSSRVNSELIGGFAANFSTSQSLIAASLARPSSSFVSAPIQPEANETGYSPWIRGIGGVVNNSSGSIVTNPDGDVSGSQADVGLKYAGVQGGFDIGRFNIENSAWNVNLGVTGGYNSGSADQKDFENKTEFNTAFIGTYLAFSRNNLFGELQARWDYTDFDVMAPDFSDRTITADTKRMSISGSTGYAIEIEEGSSFVPSVGLSYSVLDTSTIQTDLGDLSFKDTTSLFGYVSGTLAKTIVINDDTGALTPFITGTIYNDFGDDTTSFFSDINGATAEIVTDNIGTYGEVSLGLNYRGIFDETRFGGLKDLTAGVRADFTMGEELSGAGLTGQVRLQF